MRGVSIMTCLCNLDNNDRYHTGKVPYLPCVAHTSDKAHNNTSHFLTPTKHHFHALGNTPPSRGKRVKARYYAYLGDSLCKREQSVKLT